MWKSHKKTSGRKEQVKYAFKDLSVKQSMKRDDFIESLIV